MRCGSRRRYLGTTVWESTAIANAGLAKQSLYELDKGAVGRVAYERAIDSVNAANREFPGLLGVPRTPSRAELEPIAEELALLIDEIARVLELSLIHI